MDSAVPLSFAVRVVLRPFSERLQFWTNSTMSCHMSYKVGCFWLSGSNAGRVLSAMKSGVSTVPYFGSVI